MAFSGQAAITGAGELPLGRYPEHGSLELHARAARLAIADAGLTKGAIDGILTAGSRTEGYLVHAVALAEYMGIQPDLSGTLDLGGAVHNALVGYAAMAIANGLATNVLVVSGDNTLTGLSSSGVVEMLAEIGPPHAAFERTFGPTVPSLYALVAQRYLHEYGATPEDLAWADVVQRRHALLHPGAFMKEPLTVAGVLAARMIASPLRVFDCAPICDGAGAVVVSAAAAARNMPHPVVAVRGIGEHHGHHHLTLADRLTSFGARQSAARALKVAGVSLGDIDVAEIYDCFSITLLIQLEDMGFCGPGEAGAFIRAGHTSLGGRIPVNTHGGLLSHGHPGRAGGIFHMIEAVRQLRGAAGARQVPGAELALVHGTGGILSNHNTLILGRG